MTDFISQSCHSKVADLGIEKISLYKNGVKFDEAKNRLQELLGVNNHKILTSSSGENFILNKKSLSKLMSEAAVKKSINNGFTRKQHYAVVFDIDNLLINAVKLLVHPDKKGKPYVFIHRLVSPLNFDDAVAYITVKESKQHEGKRIYSVELIEIGMLEGKLEEARNSLTHFPTSNTPSNNIQIFH